MAQVDVLHFDRTVVVHMEDLVEVQHAVVPIGIAGPGLAH